MTINNKTKRPLRIPLPGGKKLHLGPGGSGQISPKAAQHPPLMKLIDEGHIEIIDDGPTLKSGGTSTNARMISAQDGAKSRSARRSGER